MRVAIVTSRSCLMSTVSRTRSCASRSNWSGKPWWITANSDAHFVYLDTVARGTGSDFTTNGFYNDAVYNGGTPLVTAGDFWPGYYSRTHVGVARDGYRAVMDGLRDGRVWVDHGGLISGLDVRARVAGDRSRCGGTPLGGTLAVKRGTRVELTIEIDLATIPNWAQFVPRLARVDVIAGDVTGPGHRRRCLHSPAHPGGPLLRGGRRARSGVVHPLVRLGGSAVLPR